MEVVPLVYQRDGFTLPLLKRPRPMPTFDNLRINGVYAEWKAKGMIFRDSGSCPRAGVKVHVTVQYSTLLITSRFPKFTVKIPLVTVAFIESSGLEFLDIRGRTFRLMLCGLDDIDEMRDSLRYLVVRQRVPHALMKKEFDWKEAEVKESQKKISKISKWSPLNCFLVF